MCVIFMLNIINSKKYLCFKYFAMYFKNFSLLLIHKFRVLLLCEIHTANISLPFFEHAQNDA